MHLYAKFDQNIPCCSRDVSIVTNTANKNTLRERCVNVLFTLQELLILTLETLFRNQNFAFLNVLIKRLGTQNFDCEIEF